MAWSTQSIQSCARNPLQSDYVIPNRQNIANEINDFAERTPLIRQAFLADEQAFLAGFHLHRRDKFFIRLFDYFFHREGFHVA